MPELEFVQVILSAVSLVISSITCPQCFCFAQKCRNHLHRKQTDFLASPDLYPVNPTLSMIAADEAGCFAEHLKTYMPYDLQLRHLSCGIFPLFSYSEKSNKSYQSQKPQWLFNKHHFL